MVKKRGGCNNGGPKLKCGAKCSICGKKNCVKPLPHVGDHRCDDHLDI